MSKMKISDTLLERFQKLSAAEYSILHAFAEEQLLKRDVVDKFVQEIVRKRVNLAEGYKKYVDKLLKYKKIDESMKRSIISRGYYAMFHLCRATIVFIYKQDIQDHTNLIKRVKRDIDDKLGEILVKWKERREICDYNPWVPEMIDSWLRELSSDIQLLFEETMKILKERRFKSYGER